jgi:hypothetical protein
MPTVDGAALPVASGGAMLRLVDPSPISTELVVDGCTTLLIEDRATLVVTGSAAAEQPAVLSGALDVAERALDLLCYRGGPALSIAYPFDEHIVWWPTSVGTHVVATATQPRRSTMSATAQGRDAQGRIVPPPAPRPPQWDESLRHFRFSQRATTLGESYRSMWLAVESLLDVIVPATAIGGEAAWVQAAFDAAENGGVPIDARIPEHVHGGTPGKRAYTYFYGSRRNLLFHSKRSRGPLPRPSEPMYRELHDALIALTPVCADLAAHLTGERRITGGMTYAGWNDLGDRLAAKGSTLHLLKQTPGDDDEVAAAALAACAAWSGGARAPETLRHPGLITYTATVRDHISAAFRTLILTVGDGPVAHAELPGTLNVSDCAQTDLRLRHRLDSSHARDRFPG